MQKRAEYVCFWQGLDKPEDEVYETAMRTRKHQPTDKPTDRQTVSDRQTDIPVALAEMSAPIVVAKWTVIDDTRRNMQRPCSMTRTCTCTDRQMHAPASCGKPRTSTDIGTDRHPPTCALTVCTHGHTQACIHMHAPTNPPVLCLDCWHALSGLTHPHHPFPGTGLYPS